MPRYAAQIRLHHYAPAETNAAVVVVKNRRRCIGSHGFGNRINLGEILGGQVEITGGISKGERIVTVGMRSLSDGENVIVTREGTCCTNGSVVFEAPSEAPAKKQAAVESSKPTEKKEEASK